MECRQRWHGVSSADVARDRVILTFATGIRVRRFYFLLQQPIQTSPADLEDRDACHRIYAQTQQSVEDGLAFLLEQRKHDPYGNALPRLFYEANNPGTQAPTFRV